MSAIKVFKEIKGFLVKQIVSPLNKKEHSYFKRKVKSISKQIESNHFLRKRNLNEIEFISNILEYGEKIEKEFQCHSNLESGTRVKGDLLITDKRIVFLCEVKGELQFFSFDYFELEEFYQSTLRDKSIGTVHAVVKEEIYTFSGIMRFGLSSWVEYVNDKMISF